MRKGASFERLLENIREFNEARREYPDSPVQTGLITVDMGNDRLLNEKFHRFWRPYVDEIMTVGMISHSGLGNPELTGRREKRTVTRPCIQLWDRMVVLSDGTVPLCCVDIRPEYRVGNASDWDLKEIWRSNTFMRFRRLHRGGRRNAIRLCSDCTFME